MDSSPSFPKEIVSELFSRVQTFFGDASFEKIRHHHVVVVGLGGVGSHAANMLIRSGVGSLRLIDFDNVTLSSLNRHAAATMEDVGVAKTEAMRRTMLKVVPWASIESFPEMFRAADADRLISSGRRPDFVLDCIDDVNTKAELIAYCQKNGLRVITSMGAGGKCDPTKIRIGTLSDCVKDPLASKIKWKLKKFEVKSDDVVTIYSCEKPVCNLLPLDDEQAESPKEYGTADYLRLRVMPVLGTSPSIFGQSMASYVLCSMSSDTMYAPDTCERMSKKLREKLLKSLVKNEKKRFQNEEVDLDEEDLEFVVHTLWNSRCAVNGKRFGGHDSLCLTRWDPAKPPTCSNLVSTIIFPNLNLFMKIHTISINFVKVLVSQSGQHTIEIDRNSLPTDVRQRILRRLEWAENFCNDALLTWNSDLMLTVDGLKINPHKTACAGEGSTFNSGFALLCIGVGVIGGFLLSNTLRKFR